MVFHHFGWVFPWLSHGFPGATPRLQDLDGVAHLPEIMRPDPEQKPTEIAQPVEELFRGCGLGSNQLYGISK